MSTASRLTTLLLVAGVVASHAADVPLTPETVRSAADSLVRGVVLDQAKDGGWPGADDTERFRHTALALLALRLSGRTTPDPAWERGLAWLMKRKVRDTIGLSLRVRVLCRHQNRTPATAAGRVLREDLRALLDAVSPGGAWGVDVPAKGKAPARTDSFSTYHVARALRLAERMGRAELPKDAWPKRAAYWTAKRCADGGWDLGEQPSDRKGRIQPGGAKGTAAMTVVGLAGIHTAYDALLASADPAHAALFGPTRNAIDAAMKWLDRRFDPGEIVPKAAPPETPAALLYLDALADLLEQSGRPALGGHDCVHEVSRRLLSAQKDNPKVRPHLAARCAAVSWLDFVTKPVAAAKLAAPGFDWQANDRDVAHLVRQISWDLCEIPMVWEVAELRAERPTRPPSAPLLVLTGEGAFRLNAEHIAALRRFLDAGGTLLGAPAGGSQKFKVSFQALCGQLLPGRRLVQLPAGHPLFAVHYRIRRPPDVLGIDNGLRTCVLFVAEDVSGSWQRGRRMTRREHFRLGANAYLYATDRRRLWDRRFRIKPAAPPNRRLPAARVKHNARWELNPDVLDHLSGRLAVEKSIALDIRAPLDPAAAKLKGIRLLWLSGFGRLQLNANQERALAAWLRAGGVLFVDPVNGDKAFHDSARALLGRLLPRVEAAAADENEPIVRGGFKPVAGHDVRKAQVTRALRREGDAWRPKRMPELLLYRVGARVAAILSRWDVSSGIQGARRWGCKGYRIEDADKIGVNVALQADQNAAGRGE